MARPKSIDVAAELNDVLPLRWLRAQARSLGMMKRQRKIDPARFVFSLILGVSSGSARSIASLRRFFALSTGTDVVASSFYKRFTATALEVLRAALERALAQVREGASGPAGDLAAFEDLLVADGSVLRLRDALASRWRACRTNHTQAAARLHVVISAVGRGAERIELSGERRSEREVLKIGPWIAGRLLLMDLGYYSFRIFERINRHGGSFLTRLKANANLKIIEDNRPSSSPGAKQLVGRDLDEIRRGLGRDLVDVMVEVRVRKGRRGRRGPRPFRRFRMVGVRHEGSRAFHWYLTNLSPEALPAEHISRLYAMRWEVELIFRELKSQLGMGQLPSANPHVVESLIIAAVIGLLLSRRLWRVIRERVGAGIRVSERRVTEMLRVLAHEVVGAMGTRTDRSALRRKWHKVLLAETCDPNRNRRLIRDSVLS